MSKEPGITPRKLQVISMLSDGTIFLRRNYSTRYYWSDKGGRIIKELKSVNNTTIYEMERDGLLEVGKSELTNRTHYRPTVFALAVMEDRKVKP